MDSMHPVDDPADFFNQHRRYFVLRVFPLWCVFVFYNDMHDFKVPLRGLGTSGLITTIKPRI
jgi:hypothetical protein